MASLSAMPSGTPTVQVSALETGRFHLPDRWLFEDGPPDVTVGQDSPDYCFLIKHPGGTKVLFDLGLRKDLEHNPQVIQDEYHILKIRVPRDVAEVLDDGPDLSKSINVVVLSHLHFDHTGDPSKFPDAEIIVGPGSIKTAHPGWPQIPGSPFDGSLFHHRHLRELETASELWKPFGPFARAYDYFKDGSFLILDAPGHMVGHLAGLARTGPEEWVLMGGDCCHHRSILVGARPISVSKGPSGQKSFHSFTEVAESTIANIRRLEKRGTVLVALAHDAKLGEVMPFYPKTLNGWKTSSWKAKLDEKLNKEFPESYPLSE